MQFVYDHYKLNRDDTLTKKPKPIVLNVEQCLALSTLREIVPWDIKPKTNDPEDKRLKATRPKHLALKYEEDWYRKISCAEIEVEHFFTVMCQGQTFQYSTLYSSSVLQGGTSGGLGFQPLKQLTVVVVGDIHGRFRSRS